VNTDSIPYDAVCQSYYPFFHGPLTAAQAAASNPNKQPAEQTALTNAATTIGKPIFVIETAEHYESGFDSNDPWYPATTAGQRQFVLDLESTLKNLPNHLGMGIDYWDGTGTNIANGGGFTAGDGKTDSTFVWNGLALFDNADSGGETDVSADMYNAVLPALSAVGGTLDASLTYKFVNIADGTLLETAAALTTSGAPLDTGADPGVISAHQQWQITSNGDGYFQIASANPATPVNVLDSQGNTADGSAVVQAAASSGAASQEWDIVSAGGGSFTVVNKASGLVLATVSGSGSTDSVVQQTPADRNADWITPKGKNQMWRIVPVHISVASSPAELAFAAAVLPAVGAGGSPGTVTVAVEDGAGALVGSTPVPVTLTITGPATFSNTGNATSTDGVAIFDLSSVALSTTGLYTLTASSPGLAGATATISVNSLAATQTQLSVSADSITAGGSVKLTATVSNGAGGAQPGGSVAFLDGTTILGTGTLSAGVASYTANGLAVGTHSITAQYSGDSVNADSTSAAVQVIVSAASDFSISVSPASATVSAGSSIGATVTLTPAGSFSSSATFACSGLPAYTTCTFSPSTVTSNGAGATTTMTIATDVSTLSAFGGEDKGLRRGSRRATREIVASASLLAVLLLPGVARWRRRGLLHKLACLAVCAIASQMIYGCGSSSSPPSPPAARTPSGQSSVTITATSGTLTHTAVFQLTVQ
jgi:hypothetical protein